MPQDFIWVTASGSLALYHLKPIFFNERIKVSLRLGLKEYVFISGQQNVHRKQDMVWQVKLPVDCHNFKC